MERCVKDQYHNCFEGKNVTIPSTLVMWGAAVSKCPELILRYLQNVCAAIHLPNILS